MKAWNEVDARVCLLFVKVCARCVPLLSRPWVSLLFFLTLYVCASLTSLFRTIALLRRVGALLGVPFGAHVEVVQSRHVHLYNRNIILQHR